MARVWISVIVGLLAIGDDLSRRRISNVIPAAAFLAGMWLQVAEHGWLGAWAGLLGAVTGGGVFLVFYILGGMGGGDIKLMAGFGAVLGWHGILEATLWTALCGGLMAAGILLFGMAKTFYREHITKSAVRAEAAGSGELKQSAHFIPYAPAIAVGVWLSLIPKA